MRRIVAGLGPRRRPSRPPDQRALRRRTPARRTGAHPVRGQRLSDARRTDQPPRHRRQGVAHVVPSLVSRRTARDQPRPRAARPGDHARAAPRRRRAHRVPRHVFAVSRRAQGRRRAPHQDRRAPGRGDSPPQHARRLDAPPDRQTRPDREEPRQTRREARRAAHRGAQARPGDPRQAPRAAACRPHRARGRRSREGLRPQGRVRGRRVRRRAR